MPSKLSSSELAVRHLRKADPVLRKLIGRVGPFAMQYRQPEFAALARSIVYQQLSTKVAARICERLQLACGELRPECVLATPAEQIRAAGLSGAKVASLLDLAAHTAQGKVRFAELPLLPDEDVISTLIQVRGIGVWTAQMFLMFALGRPDVLPTGDLGIRVGMRNLYGLEELPKPADMVEIAAPWQPYRSIASWYLWRSLDGEAVI